MSETLRILVVGDLAGADEARDPQIEDFARHLAKAVIAQGHVLLTTCRTHFDAAAAESANEAVAASGGNAKDRIISYYPRHAEPSHDFGNVKESEVDDW